MVDLINKDLGVDLYESNKRLIESHIESVNEAMAQLQARSNELLLAHNYITAQQTIAALREEQNAVVKTNEPR
jgi:hypothetical protein